MPENKNRAQILLEPEKHQALAEIASGRQVSLSQVVREIVADYLLARNLNERPAATREIRAVVLTGPMGSHGFPFNWPDQNPAISQG